MTAWPSAPVRAWALDSEAIRMLDAGCLELTVPTRSLHSRGLHVEVKNRGDFPLTATVFSACFCSLFFLKDTDQL